MEFDLVEKIVLAVLCPVFAGALLVTFYITQHRWEKRGDQRWWETRDAEWIDCDVQNYHDQLRGQR